ncbi:MAG: type II toxin-antitoxin system prevent-host-death family antitoxin [Casimicrobiaceae bacterium]
MYCHFCADRAKMTKIMTIILGSRMKTVSVAEAKAHLSALLDAAEAGEAITITRHGRPIARLQAVTHSIEPWQSLADLRAQLPPLRGSAADLINEIREEEAAKFDRRPASPRSK